MLCCESYHTRSYFLFCLFYMVPVSQCQIVRWLMNWKDFQKYTSPNPCIVVEFACTNTYQKVLRLVPWTANRWQYVNECAVLGSRERRHSACRVASLCEHWELYNTSVCHHVCRHICDFSMDMKLEQRANIKFCVKLGKSGAETFEMIRRAYRNETMSRARCFKWHVRFKRVGTSLEDDERWGRTSTSLTPKNVGTVRRLVHEDRRRTIKDIAAIVNVSHRTVQTILTCDLNMHSIAAKFVPRLLTLEQKEHRVAICQELRQHILVVKSFVSISWMTRPTCRRSSLGGWELGLWVWSGD